MPGPINHLERYAPQDEPRPGEWWKRVPPEQRDWWMNRLNQMPFADPNSFQDDITRAPNAPGAFGDRIYPDQQPVGQNWLDQQQHQLEMLGRRGR